MKPLTIQDAKSTAEKKGGLCLSETYRHSQTKLEWQCSEGHRWAATLNNIRKGHWCPECAGQGRYTLERLQDVAKQRGGELLSSSCGNAKTRLTWKCSIGHQWTAATGNIVAGQWCPICSTGLGERLCRAAFEQIFEKAFPKCYPKWLKSNQGEQLELDGYCEQLGIAFEHHGMYHYQVTRRYSKTKEELEKRINLDNQKKELCRSNNVLLIEIPQIGEKTKLLDLPKYIIDECLKLGVNIKNENISVDYKAAWSPDEQKMYADLQKIAAENRGMLISQSYCGSSEALKWRCEKDHEWMAPPNRIKSQGSWCPVCSGRNKQLKDMHDLAKQKSGKCCSTEYQGSKTELEWECENHHRFKMTPGSVIQGHWCPKCAGNAPLSLDELIKLAKSKGGLLLSDIYVNATTQMEWQCSLGHLWSAPASRIKSGSWCPECAGNMRLSLQDAMDDAKSKGGLCLSTEYVNANRQLEWKCAKGHQWRASYQQIKNGQWCPKCAGNARLSIEDMRELARAYGGECLSEQYENNKIQLEWKCQSGHTWKATPDKVKNRGQWCKDCKKMDNLN